MMSFANYTFDPTHLPNASDDDQEPGSSSLRGVKRGSRACDRCRKLKSKCEPTEGDKCKNCASAGAPCTYQGPSFKRGPPKGYIHAIEQRWHQVECILGSIMAAPQAMGIISELRDDPFARTILDRVEAGPYGPRNRGHQPAANSETFYATIMDTSDTPAREDRRIRRQSRMTREIVSIEDSNILATPTPEWQEGLIRRLTGGALQPYTSQSPSSVAARKSPTSDSSSSHYGQEEPRTRRRLEGSYAPTMSSLEQQMHEPYFGSSASYSNLDEVDDTVDSFGHLALDDMKEIRYHGHASGLPLLARSDHPKGANKDDGFWKFPSVKQEDGSDKLDDYRLADRHVQLPPLDVQHHLVDLYFAWVHPFLPVIHKERFLAHFPLRDEDSPSTTANHQSTQMVNKLLLLAIFSIAARYGSDAFWSSTGENSSSAGASWAAGAREIINNVSQCSRPSTVQALLLLGIREFGIGSMEQGWLLTDNWSYEGKDVFSPVEKQIRKKIWWSACMTDKLSAMWMGRPVTFRAKDYTTLLPDVSVDEGYEMWQLTPTTTFGVNFPSRPAMIMKCFHKQCELSVIITDIMDQIYPVKSIPEAPPRRQLLQRLEERLHKWQINLPDDLRYSAVGNAETPLPHILIVHIEYYAAVLLLHRAFIPHANGRMNDNPQGVSGDPIPMQSLDICQSAASQISTISTLFEAKYGLMHAPPFLTIYLQSAGIMHVITLSRRPGHPEASQGLRQCIHALGRLGEIWPSAKRVRVLLEGATDLEKDPGPQPSRARRDSRPKRSVEQALGEDMNTDVYPGRPSGSSYAEPSAMNSRFIFDEDANTRAMLQSLGLEVPYVDPTLGSYLPGYQYWPRQTYESMPPSSFMDASQPGPAPAETPLPATSFTFNQNDLAPQFVQGVHFPVLDPSNLFPVHPNADMPPE
ncbi:hypothetical protein DAEQUDRAFT_720214 [Daedalea quercina L-15889]|uniref:Zn(2)-C6 fungal-type domain-containing protein n=1 Tax=Daedalea quercina L-15889 TaxID=1314783 RepID=A0A165UJK2_9APHY|nr:hypothetical protein DAEQUDRAFT_720214 [Daedalea quercina L-15889]